MPKNNLDIYKTNFEKVKFSQFPVLTVSEFLF